MSGSSEQELQALIAQAQQGDRPALGDLYGRYAPLVLRFLYLRLRDHELAQDLTQEVFIRVVKNLKGFEYRNEKSFIGWLYTIAHHIIADHVRRPPLLTTPLDEGLELVDTRGQDEVRILTERLSIQQALSKLTPEQQQVLTLKFFGSRSNGEIAQIMGRSEGAIKALQYRAIQALQPLLSGETSVVMGAAEEPLEEQQAVGETNQEYARPLARGRERRSGRARSEQGEAGSVTDSR